MNTARDSSPSAESACPSSSDKAATLLAVCGLASNAPPERVLRRSVVLNIHAQVSSLPWPSRLCYTAKRSRVHGRKTVLASFQMCFGVNYNVYRRQFRKVLTPTRMAVHTRKRFWPQAQSVWPQGDLKLATGEIAPRQAKELTLTGVGTGLPPRPKDNAAAYSPHPPLLVKTRDKGVRLRRALTPEAKFAIMLSVELRDAGS